MRFVQVKRLDKTRASDAQKIAAHEKTISDLEDTIAANREVHAHDCKSRVIHGINGMNLDFHSAPQRDTPLYTNIEKQNHIFLPHRFGNLQVLLQSTGANIVAYGGYQSVHPIGEDCLVYVCEYHRLGKRVQYHAFVCNACCVGYTSISMYSMSSG